VPVWGRLLAVLLSAVACFAVVGLPVRADDDPSELRDRIDSARDRERALSGDVARLGALAAKVERQLATLQRRVAEVQAELARDEARLAGVQADLRKERARLARLRARLAETREQLALRLRERYTATKPDIVSVVLGAHSFANLLERADFLRRIQRADQQIVIAVRVARRDAARETKRLAKAEDVQREVVGALRMRRDALASMTAAVAARRETLVRVRAARAAALSATRGSRRQLQSKLRAAERAIAKAASTGGPAAKGPWSIPWEVVQCESGGQNFPPNHAGASGYYQIIPETWKRHGGSGPAAHLASKAEQDRVAARIWATDGPDSWVCHGLVN
jgi:peptidoglycan hydrolase CwlO-like protein